MLLFESNTAFVLQGIPSGRLPRRFAPRNDIVLRTEYKSLFDGNLLQNFRTFFILFRATHFMSLRAKRGNLPKGNLVKQTRYFFQKGT